MSPDAAAGDCVIGATLQPWSLSSEKSLHRGSLLLSLYRVCRSSTPASLPFETSVPSSPLRLRWSAVVVGRRLHSTLARRQLLRLFTIRERCNDVLRPRVYARAAVRERAMFFLKNVHDSLIKSHDPILPFRILRWCVQRFIVCRSGSVYRLAGLRSVSPKLRRIKNTVYLMVNDRLLEQVSARYTRSPCLVVWRENKLII